MKITAQVEAVTRNANSALLRLVLLPLVVVISLVVTNGKAGI
jgi:hypothetical protein